MEVFDAIRSRRSVREFKDDEIPYPVIARLMEVIRWAPSAGNTFHTKAIFVKDPDVKKKLANACLDQEWVQDAPVIIMMMSETGKVTRAFGDQGKLYALQSTAAATQNLMLEAEELGLATCWIGAFSEDRIKRTLRIPQSAELHNMVALGYPKRKRTRTPAKAITADIIKFDSWQSPVKDQKDFPAFWKSDVQLWKKKLGRKKKKK